jgi:hypothetical protein
MVVAASRDERGLRPEALPQLEPEHVHVKGERAVDVRDLQVHVADVDAGIDRHGAGRR